MSVHGFMMKSQVKPVSGGEKNPTTLGLTMVQWSVRYVVYYIPRLPTVTAQLLTSF